MCWGLPASQRDWVVHMWRRGRARERRLAERCPPAALAESLKEQGVCVCRRIRALTLVWVGVSAPMWASVSVGTSARELVWAFVAMHGWVQISV